MIRAAVGEDTEAVGALVRQLGYERNGAHQLADICARSDHAVFVAVDSDRVVGFIHVCEVVNLESETFGEIRGLAVDEGCRGRGFGERLVAAAEEWTRGRKLFRIRVRSNVIRERARHFYERLGYNVTKSQNVFDKLFRQ